MKKNLYLLLSLLPASVISLTAQTVTDSLNFTGGLQTYTIPCGVTSVTIECRGAQGGGGAAGNSSGGATAGGVGALGGLATGTLAVSPGDVLNVFVGGAGVTPTGGFNGGGNGGNQNAGGGGGASDVRVGGTAEANRVITAGGGGGGGRGGCESGTTIAGGNGGLGGGGNGANGVDAPTSGGSAGGGAGAVGSTGGAAGIGCGGFLGAVGGTASTGTGANGGAGQSCCCFSFGSIPGGGGGGGGQVGGGGGGGGSAGTSGCSGNDKGAGGGGAGGTSSTAGVTSGSATNGVRTGNGVVKFTYVLPTPTAVTISGNSSLCTGDSANLTATTSANATFYTWTVPVGLTFNSGQNTTSINITGATPGTYTVTCQPVNGTCSLSGPTATFVVTVNALPVVAASSTSATICDGDSSILSVTGAATYTWMPGSLSGTPVTVTPNTTTTYTVTGTDVNGCVDSDVITVSVNALPTVSASSDSTICNGESVSLSASGAVIYAWNPGSLTGNPVTVSPTSTTTYTVTGTDSSGCSNMATVTITVNALPTIAATAVDSSICVGGSVSLTGTGGTAYAWMPGSLTGSTVTASPTSNTTYTVTGTDANGCSNTATIDITVNALPTPTLTSPATVCVGDGNYTLTGSPAGGTFSGTGVTGNSFSPSTAGTGTFTITYSFTDANGCTGTDGNSVTVGACTGIVESQNMFGLTFMPNPVSDLLQIRWDGNKGNVTNLDIYDNLGRLVASQQVSNQTSAQINVTQLPAGNYNLRVTAETGRATYQFIKN
ncbi:MAG: hypothetical protein FD123_1899 [Bacteroidetes bacterium]|nr:MAG: hypothetical protein FD123_1899 [Bacteroidota bacterium]